MLEEQNKLKFVLFFLLFALPLQDILYNNIIISRNI
jgi:hypothetical protein